MLLIRRTQFRLLELQPFLVSEVPKGGWFYGPHKAWLSNLLRFDVCCRIFNMSSIQGNFSIAAGASVAVQCASGRNILHLHTAWGGPTLGEGAMLAFHSCDVFTFQSAAAALDRNSQATDIFGTAVGAAAHMTDCTLLHNWAVRS
jgi:hypothetical protein